LRFLSAGNSAEASLVLHCSILVKVQILVRKVEMEFFCRPRSKMTELFVSPGRYIQKKGVIQNIGRFALPLGQRPLVLGDETVFAAANAVGKRFIAW